MSILNIVLICISLFLLILYLISSSKYEKLYKEYNEYKRTKYRDSNKIVMLEYYLRSYKESNGNIYTLFRDLYDLIYNSD